jgi:hypothetical protein
MFLGMVYLFVSMNSTSQTGSSICSREKTNYMLYIAGSMLVNYPMSKKYYGTLHRIRSSNRRVPIILNPNPRSGSSPVPQARDHVQRISTIRSHPTFIVSTAMELLSRKGSTADVYRLEHGLVCKAPRRFTTYTAERRAWNDNAFVVERQLLERLGRHPRIVEYVS